MSASGPCGSLAIKRVPRGERPWRRVILVLAQSLLLRKRGFVDEHQALGVKPALVFLPLGPATGDVGVVLFAGV
jgi:hypothetical protein